MGGMQWDVVGEEVGTRERKEVECTVREKKKKRQGKGVFSAWRKGCIGKGKGSRLDRCKRRDENVG